MLSDGTALAVPGPVEEDGQAREEQESQEPENSPATGAPTIAGTARVGETLTADVSGIADADGLTGAVFGYQWLADGAEIAGAANSTYTLAADDEGRAVSVQVSFSDDAGNEEAVTSGPTAAVAPKPNSTATGQPTISGTAQVGETLTANTSSIADADGLDNATFAYQWVRNDGNTGTDIESATDSTYELSDADVGKTIKVRASFTDDRGHEESLTSTATNPVAGLPPEPLTARFENRPSSHDGENVFTFELRFSEEPKDDFSYTTLRDHAFTVIGGRISGVRRLEPPGNVRWEIQVRPGSRDSVSIVLPHEPRTARRTAPSARKTAGSCPTDWSSPSAGRAGRPGAKRPGTPADNADGSDRMDHNRAGFLYAEWTTSVLRRRSQPQES